MVTYESRKQARHYIHTAYAQRPKPRLCQGHKRSYSTALGHIVSRGKGQKWYCQLWGWSCQWKLCRVKMCWRVFPRMCRHCFIISIKPNVTGIYFVVLSYVSAGNLNPSLHIVSNWLVPYWRNKKLDDLQKALTVPGLDQGVDCRPSSKRLGN